MATSQQRVTAVRRFNRFYTRRIGVLQGGLLESPYSLTEVRVMYELAHRNKPTATQLGGELGLDAGYLSRILRRFRKEGLLASAGSKEDARRTHLWLSAKGRRTFDPLERGTNREVAAMLGQLPVSRQEALVAAMKTVEELLGGHEQAKAQITLRQHRPGDMGWVIAAHGALYAQEFGFDATFEALVAEIAAQFIRKFDPERERCWIAELDGEPVGSVFLVQQSKSVAKLRLLIIDPKARGLGLGKRLVAECIAHARALGYRKLTLWTQSNLLAARHIYKEAGFRLAQTEPHRSFGVELVGEFWELKL
ncbi:MAG: MarR family transcriptional regulator [Proteobacteria bacterium]|nr:MarR family transcriptional regulator [Pseudomonadota bacterium]